MKRSEPHFVASVTRRHNAEVAKMALKMLKTANMPTDDDQFWMVAVPHARAFLQAIQIVRQNVRNEEV